jgi:hypothetical protein
LPPDHSMTARRAQEARGFVQRGLDCPGSPQAQIDSMDSLRRHGGRHPKARAEVCWYAATASHRCGCRFTPPRSTRLGAEGRVDQGYSAALFGDGDTTIEADRLATLPGPNTKVS